MVILADLHVVSHDFSAEFPCLSGRVVHKISVKNLMEARTSCVATHEKLDVHFLPSFSVSTQSFNSNITKASDGQELLIYTSLYYVTNWCIMADLQTLNCRYSFGIQPT